MTSKGLENGDEMLHDEFFDIAESSAFLARRSTISASSSEILCTESLDNITKPREGKRKKCLSCFAPFPEFQCLDCPGRLLQRLYCTSCANHHTQIDKSKDHKLSELPQPKWPRAKPCEHGREKKNCKDCGGSNVCFHGGLKSHCKQCMGSQICQHMKLKRICKDCHGSGICEHNKIRYYCKSCNVNVDQTVGKSNNTLGSHKKCEHNREKRDCKECGGSRICEHSRFKLRCRDCATNKREKLSHNNVNLTSMTSSSSNSRDFTFNINEENAYSSSSYNQHYDTSFSYNCDFIQETDNKI